MGTVKLAGNGHRRRETVRRLKAEGRPCHICGLPIDPNATGAEAFNCDEIVPRKRGGSPTDYANVDAAHACCNNWRAAKSMRHVELVRAAVLAAFGAWRSPAEFAAHAKRVERDMRAGRTTRPKPRPTARW